MHSNIGIQIVRTRLAIELSLVLDCLAWMASMTIDSRGGSGIIETWRDNGHAV